MAASLALGHCALELVPVSRRAAGLSSAIAGHRLCARPGWKRMRRLEGVACGARAGLGDAPDNKERSPTSFTSEDWQYLGKFSLACSAGAALIKYGSVLVPEITRPNLLQALVMITLPVAASVLLLLLASQGQQSKS